VYDGETLQKVAVTVGFYGDTNVEITDGIAPGDRLMVNPSGIKSYKRNWLTDQLDSLYESMKRIWP
jgi:hypothetical protein